MKYRLSDTSIFVLEGSLGSAGAKYLLKKGLQTLGYTAGSTLKMKKVIA
jgi:hypothetical protein